MSCRISWIRTLSILFLLSLLLNSGCAQKIVVEETVPALLEALKDGDAGVRRVAAEALGRIGPGAQEAIPELIKALKDKHEYVRIRAAEVLGSIGPEVKEVVPALIEALKDKHAYVRMRAAEALGSIGPEAKEPPLRSSRC